VNEFHQMLQGASLLLDYSIENLIE